MKRIAFFVEGFSEQLFLEKLLSEIFNQKSIAIESARIRGGNKCPINIVQLTTPSISDETKYYLLIYNCGGDKNVKSYIIDQRESLKNAGYTKIVGLRDVHPFPYSEISKLRIGLNWGMPQRDLPTVFLLSVMEIEAWCLAEESHYTRINLNLTPALIFSQLNWDPSTYNTELFAKPSDIINDVYKLVNFKYEKDGTTINNLDFANLYLNVNKRISSLNELIEEIHKIF